jgi:hypothetical protein
MPLLELVPPIKKLERVEDRLPLGVIPTVRQQDAARVPQDRSEFAHRLPARTVPPYRSLVG